MVTTVYIIRHCESEGNITEIFQGHYDGDVTPKGQLQLDKLAERCKDIPFDVIYASPLKRAYKTAEAVNRYHNLPIHKEPGIMEINGGDMEGHRWDKLDELFPEENKKWQTDFCNFKAPNGESVRDVYKRMKETVTRIVSENKGKTICLCSHGGAIRIFSCYAHGLPVERIDDMVWCDNTAINCYEFDDSLTPKVVFENSCEHINNDESTKAHQLWWKDEK